MMDHSFPLGSFARSLMPKRWLRATDQLSQPLSPQFALGDRVLVRNYRAMDAGTVVEVLGVAYDVLLDKDRDQGFEAEHIALESRLQPEPPQTFESKVDRLLARFGGIDSRAVTLYDKDLKELREVLLTVKAGVPPQQGLIDL